MNQEPVVQTISIPVTADGVDLTPVETAIATIVGALMVLRTVPPTRQTALAITKLEEARMWLKESGQ